VTRDGSGAAPARWTSLALRAVLPCDAMREAIFGDLHEEFVREIEQIGWGPARARYRDRVIGIVAHALWDTFRWRAWASTPPPPADGSPLSADRRGRREWEEGLRVAVVRSRAIGRAVAFSVLGLAVLTVGIVVNTSVFAAVEGAPLAAIPQAPGVSPSGLTETLAVLGFALGGLALMTSCAIVGALIICFGPRWRGRRARAASRP